MPNVELSAAIHTIESRSFIDARPNTSSSETKADTTATSVFDETVLVQTDDWSGEPGSTSPRDSEYEDADTLDWDESVDVAGAADGIGSLSMDWKGIGYMGPQTGNTLLKKLQSISLMYFPVNDDLSLQQSPLPEMPNHVLGSPHFTTQCIDWYFRYYHCAYPILHEGYFRAQLMGNAHLLTAYVYILTQLVSRRSSKAQGWVLAGTAKYRASDWRLF